MGTEQPPPPRLRRVTTRAVDLTVPPLAELAARRSEKWSQHPPHVLSSTVAEMDFPVAPAVTEVLREAIERHDFGYPVGAPASLFEAFAGFAQRRLTWSPDPARMTLTPDVMVALGELARALSGPGGEVVFAAPAYPPFWAAPASIGLKPVAICLLPDGSFDLAALDARLSAGARVVLLANPHNPTGRVLTRAELEAIADLAAHHDAWVISDEIHAPLVLPGAEHVVWHEVSATARQRGFVLTSASKAFNLAGLKAALIVTASEETDAVVRDLPPIGHHAGLLGVTASEAAFAQGDAWLDAVLVQIAANRDQLGALLAEHLPEARWTPPQGTYLAWIDLREYALPGEAADVLLAHGDVALASGSKYDPQDGAGFVRLNMATSPALLKEAVRRMAVAIAAVR